MLDTILWSIALALTIVLALLATAPFVRSGRWYIRVWDFPRLQLAGLTVVPGLLLAVVLLHNSYAIHAWILLGVLALIALLELVQLLPFTRLWPREVPDIGADGHHSSLTLLVANICYASDRYNELASAIKEVDPDVLLLIEVDGNWSARLQHLEHQYEHRIQDVLGEGLGLALWSKLPLHDARIEHLISTRRPSIFADIELGNGRKVSFVGVHPTPPALADSTGDGRRDSNVRDAELVVLARHVAEHPRRHWVVAGDFNDVAWSHTTRLFKRLSGLRDPRVGRKLLNTYNAQHPLLRYPVDHLFVAPGFTISEIDRIRLPGSDHFGVHGRLYLQPDAEAAPADPDDDSEDRREAKQSIERGVDDARKRSVAVPTIGPTSA